MATMAAPIASASSVSLRPARSLALATPAFSSRVDVRVGARGHPRSFLLRVRASTAEAGQTFSNVQTIIAEQLAVDKEKITPDSKFVDLGADSLDTVEIMMALEEKFEIQLDAEKGETIKTVQDAVGLIEETVLKAAK